MIRKILVPLDGSEFGEHALPLAASMAKKTGAMVHVHQNAPAFPSAGVELLDLYDLHLRREERHTGLDADPGHPQRASPSFT